MARGKLFQGLLNTAKQVAAPSLTSGALATGVSLLGGSNPLTALAYGLGDTLASGGSVAAVRALRPKSYQQRRVKDLKTGRIETINKTSRAETPVNFLTSVGTGYGLSSILEPRPVPTNYSQEQQIMTQMIERAQINDLPIQAVAPGTQFQMAGMEFLDDIPRQMQLAGNWQQYLTPQDQAVLSQYGIA